MYICYTTKLRESVKIRLLPDNLHVWRLCVTLVVRLVACSRVAILSGRVDFSVLWLWQTRGCSDSLLSSFSITKLHHQLLAWHAWAALLVVFVLFVFFKCKGKTFLFLVGLLSSKHGLWQFVSKLVHCLTRSLMEGSHHFSLLAQWTKWSIC